MIRYRLTASPSRALPLNVRSAGHYRFPAGHREMRESGAFLQLFWTISGTGRMLVVGQSVSVPSGGFFYYENGEAHDLLAGPRGWEYRWLTLDGPDSAAVIPAYRLQRVQSANPCPSLLFDQIDAALQDPTPSGEARASLLAYDILLRATEPTANPPTTGDAEAARAWLDTHYNDARLNVAALAERFGLHRSSLHRQFMRSHGVAPVQYLGRLRLRCGLELLTNTRLPIADVAVQCGLPDIAHFSKLVSRHTGYSPRAYRNRQPQAQSDIGPGAA